MPFAARRWNPAAISAATIAPRETSDHQQDQLTGFFLIEVQNLDEAMHIAAQIPPARTGSIEVRPVRPIRETVARATMGR